jgi:hypothetical protein
MVGKRITAIPRYCSNPHVLPMTHVSLLQAQEGFHMLKNDKPKVIFILRNTTFASLGT